MCRMQIYNGKSRTLQVRFLVFKFHRPVLDEHLDKKVHVNVTTKLHFELFFKEIRGMFNVSLCNYMQPQLHQPYDGFPFGQRDCSERNFI